MQLAMMLLGLTSKAPQPHHSFAQLSRHTLRRSCKTLPSASCLIAPTQCATLRFFSPTKELVFQPVPR
jgi:hypothetical protein